MNKIRVLAQVVGFCTLGLLALYGALALFGSAGPLPLALQAFAQGTDAQGEFAALPAAAIPATINYQGFVRKPDGSLVTGSYTVTARIYAVLAGGTALYTTTIENVNVRDGLFNIVLGDDPLLPPDVLSATLRYIGIDLGDGELIPRQRLHAVPWAMTANTANTLVPNAAVQGFSSAGNVAVTGNIAATGNITATKNVRVDGDLDVKRSYQVFHKDAGSALGVPANINQGPLGEWDLCALMSYEVSGQDNTANDWAKCKITPRAVDENWQNYGKWTKDPGQRVTWYLQAAMSGWNDWVRCQAICMNFGD